MRRRDPIKTEEKRRDILAAATRAIARKGFQGVSTDDICKEAGISPGQLYHYFPNRQAVLAGVTSAWLARFSESVARTADGDDPVAPLLAILDRFKKNPDSQVKARSILALDVFAEAGRNPAIAKIVHKHSTQIRGLLADLLKKGQERGQVERSVNPANAAAAFFVALDGVRALIIRNPEADLSGPIELLQAMISQQLLPDKKR
jgi:AcrR family transcriptional regulator